VRARLEVEIYVRKMIESAAQKYGFKIPVPPESRAGVRALVVDRIEEKIGKEAMSKLGISPAAHVFIDEQLFVVELCW
jgi:hypothetical protein